MTAPGRVNRPGPTKGADHRSRLRAAFIAWRAQSPRRKGSPRVTARGRRGPGSPGHTSILSHNSRQNVEDGAPKNSLCQSGADRPEFRGIAFAVHCLKPPTKSDSDFPPCVSSQTQKKCMWSGMTTKAADAPAVSRGRALPLGAQDSECSIVVQEGPALRDANGDEVDWRFD